TIERCKQLTNGRTIISLLGVLQTFFTDYIGELKRVVNNIRERHSKILGNEDWELFRQTIRILEICGELILAYEQFESSLVQQMVQMINEWHNKTNKYKQNDDIFDLSIESFINNIASSDKHDFLSIIWSSENRGTIVADLPSFSLVPQENITKIGQYLLMLPQHFEPFNLHDNQQLRVAFKKGKLPYLEDKELSNDLTSCWLDSVALATMRVCMEQTLQIQTLNSAGL
ncbi:unnamed protein product, partial [Adineta steineri]